MVSITGGTVTGSQLEGMVEPTLYEEWYETDGFETDDAALAMVHHGMKDPAGHAVWEGDDGFAVVYGAFTNRHRLGFDGDDDLFPALLDRPSVVLPKLDGPFALAALDRTDGSVLLATDKAGTRTLYYSLQDGLLFGSDLKSIATRLDGVDVDVRAVVDLLTYGHAFGDRTLVEGVRSVPPASMLRYADGDASVTRYWQPVFGERDPDGYVEESLAVYRRAMGDVTDTIDGTAGLYLSGGLDSRTMAAVLKEELGSFRTFTYDANPGKGVNIAPARRVAELLGVENEVTPFEPEEFAGVVRRGVALTDGMIDWGFFINLPFVLEDLHSRVDVVMEGAPQGEYFGEDVWLYNLTRRDPVDGVFSLWGMNGPDTVRSLMAPEVEPKRSIVEQLEQSHCSDPVHRTLDTIRRSWAYGHYRSNKLHRSQVGMRLPWPHGEFLDHVAAFPHDEYRIRTLPFTGGRIPVAVSPLKLELVRKLDSGLESVPYERTKVAPSRPLAVHAAGYGYANVRDKLSSRPNMFTEWYRESDAMASFVDDTLASAAERPFFDADELAATRRRVKGGESEAIRALSPVSTVEVWLQQNVD